MKKLLSTLFIACLVVLAHAQDAPKKPTSFSWNKAALTEIGCDAEQIKKISEIRKAASEKRKQLTEDTTLDESAKKAELKKVNKERNDALKAVLTEEQNQKVQEINAKLKAEASN